VCKVVADFGGILRGVAFFCALPIPSLYPLHDIESCCLEVIGLCSQGLPAIQHRAPASRLFGNLSAIGVPTNLLCCRRSSGPTDVAPNFLPRWYDLNPIFRCAARWRRCRICEPLYLTPIVNEAQKKRPRRGRMGRSLYDYLAEIRCKDTNKSFPIV
jgi:hypothetical protein